MKICINCKHYVLDDKPTTGTITVDKCARKGTTSTDLVTGLTYPIKLLECKYERYGYSFSRVDICGEEGKYFEIKRVKI